jgi:hypothetical protein
MATVDQAKMVRDSKLDLFIRPASSDGWTSSGVHAGTIISTGLSAYRVVSTAGSTLSSDDANLFVPFDEGGKIGFLVGWACTNVQDSTTVNLVLHDATGVRGSWRRDLGKYTLTLCTQGSSGPLIRKWMIGPFDDARFGVVCDASSAAVGVARGQKYAHLELRLGANSSLAIAAGATTGDCGKTANILPFRWPDVQYDT